MIPLVFIAALGASEPVKLAVLELESVDVPAPRVALLVEHLAQSLAVEGIKVTTARQIGAILGVERQRQLLGCEEGSSNCVAELANALGAEVVVTGSVARIGTSLKLSATFVSARDGATLTSLNATRPSEEELYAEVAIEAAAAAGRIVARLRPGFQLEPARPGVRRWSWLPAIGAVGFGVGAAVLLSSASALHTRLGSESFTPAAADALVMSGQRDEVAGWLLASAATAALGAAVVMFVLGTPTEARVVPVAIVTPSGGGAAINVRWP